MPQQFFQRRIIAVLVILLFLFSANGVSFGFHVTERQPVMPTDSRTSAETDAFCFERHANIDPLGHGHDSIPQPYKEEGCCDDHHHHSHDFNLWTPPSLPAIFLSRLSFSEYAPSIPEMFLDLCPPPPNSV